jgi:hypothetical protein
MSAQSPWEFAHELQEQYRLDVPDIVLNVYDALAVNVIGALPAELRNVPEDFPIIVLPTTGRWTSLDDFEIQLLKICARQAVHVMRLL